jgi:hypothetical protein
MRRPPATPRTCPGRLVGEADGRPLYGLSIGDHHLAGLGQAAAGLAALEQLEAQVMLQALDPPRDGRLVDAQGLGRRQGRASAGHGQERLQVIPVEHDPILQLCRPVLQERCFPARPLSRIVLGPAHGPQQLHPSLRI